MIYWSHYVFNENILKIVQILSELYESGKYFDHSTLGGYRLNYNGPYIKFHSFDDYILFSTNKSELNTSLINSKRISFIPGNNNVLVDAVNYNDVGEDLQFQIQCSAPSSCIQYLNLFYYCNEIEFQYRFTVRGVLNASDMLEKLTNYRDYVNGIK